MTEGSMPLLALRQKHSGGDCLKELPERVLQRLMEFEVGGIVGGAAGRGAFCWGEGQPQTKAIAV